MMQKLLNAGNPTFVFDSPFQVLLVQKILVWARYYPFTKDKLSGMLLSTLKQPLNMDL